MPLIVVAAIIGWGVLRKNTPPKATLVKVKRQELVSTLPTNGKAEPIDWQPVRAETSGLVTKVAVQEGQTVAKGALLAEMRDPALEADIEAAQAKVDECRANLAALEAGGRPADLADIENSLARARFDLQKQQKELATLQRLEQQQAATRVEVQAASDKVRQIEMEIAGLEKRRGSLVARPEVEAAKARLDDAGTALKLARERAALSVVRAPMAGEVYGLSIRPGAYLNTGDLAANIGRLDRLRVRVYVDEPLLGRVAEGQPVVIRWEALPGKQWHGTVSRKPTDIQALGSRQVGEVICIIENPGRDLIPGTNIDAEIRTGVTPNALVIPKEALRHDAAGDYVLLRQGDTVERRAVKTGNSTVTLVQIAEGLAEGDEVAMPGDVPLKPGDRITPMSN
ncbi:MAG TPA: efflux RND transporter periplasmic adaptor subunit [Candidatus Sulfopaludibacter sp.]|nr:efflux RND transporter periplasmic adaptor subunit [Candidatus Sulfopaludibacter sp.]